MNGKTTVYDSSSAPSRQVSVSLLAQNMTFYYPILMISFIYFTTPNQVSWKKYVVSLIKILKYSSGYDLIMTYDTSYCNSASLVNPWDVYSYVCTYGY